MICKASNSVFVSVLHSIPTKIQQTQPVCFLFDAVFLTKDVEIQIKRRNKFKKQDSELPSIRGSMNFEWMFPLMISSNWVCKEIGPGVKLPICNYNNPPSPLKCRLHIFSMLLCPGVIFALIPHENRLMAERQMCSCRRRGSALGVIVFEPPKCAASV